MTTTHKLIYNVRRTANGYAYRIDVACSCDPTRRLGSAHKGAMAPDMQTMQRAAADVHWCHTAVQPATADA